MPALQAPNPVLTPCPAGSSVPFARFPGGDVPLEGLGISTQQQKQSCGSLPLCSWGGLVPLLEVCITRAKCANIELEYFPS